MATANTKITSTKTMPGGKPDPAWVQLDALSGLLMQLDALLTHTCGESFESFENLNDEAKHWYLMHVSDIATQCKQDAARITELLCQEVQTAKAKGKSDDSAPRVNRTNQTQDKES